MSVRTPIVIAVAVLLGGLVLGSQARTRRERRDLLCESNLHDLAIAVQMYLSDNAGTYPDSDRWADALNHCLKDSSVLKCPLETSAARTSYGMNARLSGLRSDELRGPIEPVLFYETKHPGDDPSGGPDDVVSPPRHAWGNAYASAGYPRAYWSEEILPFGP